VLNLSTLDRLVLGLITLFLSPRRIRRCGALIEPATLLKFHKALVDRKYRLLFSSGFSRRKPGPKGPSPSLIAANRGGETPQSQVGICAHCQADSYVFGGDLDKDVVRRVLAKHYLPPPGKALPG
jgi:putative transposase